MIFDNENNRIRAPTSQSTYLFFLLFNLYQYTDFVHSDFPCVNDAKKLCSAQHTVDSVMTCLEAQRNKSILEPSCEDMVNGLTYCNGKNSNRRDHFANSSRGSEGWAEKPPPKHNSGRRHSGGRSPPDKPAPEDSAMTRVRRHRRALGTADVAANSGGGGGSGNMEPPCWASWDQQAGSSSSSSSNRKNRPTDKSASSSSSMDDTESGREEGNDGRAWRPVVVGHRNDLIF